MSTIKCPECNRDIYDKVDECPFCGCPSEFFPKSDSLAENNTAPESSIVQNDDIGSDYQNNVIQTSDNADATTGNKVNTIWNLIVNLDLIAILGAIIWGITVFGQLNRVTSISTVQPTSNDYLNIVLKYSWIVILAVVAQAIVLIYFIYKKAYPKTKAIRLLIYCAVISMFLVMKYGMTPESMSMISEGDGLAVNNHSNAIESEDVSTSQNKETSVGNASTSSQQTQEKNEKVLFFEDVKHFDDATASRLNEELNKSAKEVNMDIVFMVADNLTERGVPLERAQSFAESTYKNKGYDKDGVFLILDYKNVNWILTCFGRASDIFDNSTINAVLEHISSTYSNSDVNILEATQAYIEEVERYTLRNGKTSDQVENSSANNDKVIESQKSKPVSPASELPDYYYELSGQYYDEDSQIDVIIFSDGSNNPCGYISTYDMLYDNNGYHDITYAGYNFDEGFEIFYLNDNPNIQLWFGTQIAPAVSMPVYTGEELVEYREGYYYYFVLVIDGQEVGGYMQSIAWMS